MLNWLLIKISMLSLYQVLVETSKNMSIYVFSVVLSSGPSVTKVYHFSLSSHHFILDTFIQKSARRYKIL